MNPVVLLCYNNLEMTKQALQSALAQDIPTSITVINNGSTDGTRNWLDSVREPSVHVIHLPRNTSPILICNSSLQDIFTKSPHVLCIPNDVVIPPNLYREMLRWPRGFITASETKECPPPKFETSRAQNECTPMAVMLVRKWAYDALVAKDGYFMDPGYFHYASDCDMALRMASCGLRGVQLDIQYYHYGSASWKTMAPPQQQAVNQQADRDRYYFKTKWGFAVDSLEYGQVAADPNWRAENR